MVRTTADDGKRARIVDDDDDATVDSEDEQEQVEETDYVSSEKYARDKKVLEADLSASEDEKDSDGEDADERGDGNNRIPGEAVVSATPIERTMRRGLGECGKLKRIELWDFMCHKRLSVDFSSGMTCITGSNGSGKSAIVVALQVCLGMSANETRRGGRLSELIRNGAAGGAKIQIHLGNEGPRAYFPEEFSDLIIVERTILPRATQSKIFNGRTKRVVRTKKKDVEDLADALALHVDNPCCVLDQETAKLFLKGSGQDKYKFFLKATDLATIVREFVSQKEEKDRAEAEFEQNMKLEKQLKEKFDAAQNEYNRLNQLRDLAEQVSKTETELSWALYMEKLAEKKAAEEALATLELQLEVKATKVKAAEEALGGSQKKLEQLKEEVQTIKAGKDQLQAQIKEARKELKDRQVPINKKQAELKNKNAELEELRERKSELEKKIQGLMARAARTGPDSVERVNAELASKRKVLQELDQRPDGSLDQVQEEREQMMIALEGATKDAVKAKAAVESLKKQQVELDRQLKLEKSASATAKNSSFAQLGKFHFWLPKLMEELQTSTKFQTKPIFVGQHVRLIRREYQLPIEIVIASTLGSFIVGSIDDEKQLRELAVKCGARSHDVNIFVRRLAKERIDISQGKPGSDWLTMADALEINDPNVFNTLVDVNRIEAIALLKDESERERVWLGSSADARMPEKVITAYAMNGDSFSVRGRSRVYEACTRRDVRLLNEEAATVSMNAKIQDLEQRIEKNRQDIANMSRSEEVHARKAAEFKAQLQTLLDKERTFVASVEAAIKKRGELEQAIETLMEKVQELSSGQDALSLQRYRDEIKATEEEEVDVQNHIVAFKQEISKATRDSLGPVEQRIKDLEGEVRTEDEKWKELVAEVESFSHLQLDQEVKEAKEAESDVANQIAHGRKTLAETVEGLVRVEQVALNYSSTPVEVRDRPSVIRRRLQGLNASLESERRRASIENEGTEARLIRAEAELERCKKSYENVRADRKSVKKRIKMLKKMMKNRKKRYQDFRLHAEQTTREGFAELLRQKGHDGDVIFDHEKEQIEIRWFRKKQDAGTSTQMSQEEYDSDGEGQQKAFTDAKSLSGGERSTTTLALLLAMGMNVQSPFKVMDEFDVFMDAGARSIALAQLVEDAKHSVNGVRKQYILLSPTGFQTLHADQSLEIRKVVITPDESSFGKGGSRQTQAVLDQFVSAQ